MNPIDDQRQQKLQAAAINAQARVEKGLGHFRRSLLVKALLLAVLGLCALFWPGASMKILVQLVGLFCVVDGLTGLFTSIRASDGRAYMGAALVSLLIGAVLLFWPGATKILLLLFGAWMFYTGIRNILYSRQLNEADPERGALRTIGIAACVVGLVLLLWPGAGVATISWVIGIAALLIAALLAFVASRLKRVVVRVESIGQ